MNRRRLAAPRYILVTLPMLLALACGCNSPTTPPPASDQAPASSEENQQLGAVRSGASDSIMLTEVPISPQGLRDLPALDGKLTTLLLDAGGVNDETMSTLAKIKSLVHLRVRESDISDAGIKNLAVGKLTELRILNIPQCRVTAQGISAMVEFPQLVQLRLGGRQIDDLAVSELIKLPKLSSLHLIGPNLSDAALRNIAQCTSLSSFYLDDCPISDAAWETLFSAKPNLHVHVNQQHHDRDPHAQPH